ncbi:hypothetical protein ML462_07860 [Gramella lutea]|uniref:Uncharacterized protein n=1 Tax=Christiangramia lutea TaxID=1607951 RepID=A0A9X2A8Z8_9FLAO|nr:hypothetical protein [Christiangramia lutea]MCH4823089.1 hypothetical protein [Christiangramia lutea]
MPSRRKSQLERIRRETGKNKNHLTPAVKNLLVDHRDKIQKTLKQISILEDLEG